VGCDGGGVCWCPLLAHDDDDDCRDPLTTGAVPTPLTSTTPPATGTILAPSTTGFRKPAMYNEYCDKRDEGHIREVYSQTHLAG